MNNKEKDELFYSDLSYRIRQLAGLEISENEETNQRILQREEMVDVNVNGKICHEISEFQAEVFDFIIEVGLAVGENFKSATAISKYPDVVSKMLKEIEITDTIEKDELFYSDLSYRIRQLAGLEISENEETNQRILQREEMVDVNVNGKICHEISEFEAEVFNFIIEVGLAVGENFRSATAISKYPDVVREMLKEIEITDTNKKVKTNKNK